MVYPRIKPLKLIQVALFSKVISKYYLPAFCCAACIGFNPPPAAPRALLAPALKIENLLGSSIAPDLGHTLFASLISAVSLKGSSLMLTAFFLAR